MFYVKTKFRYAWRGFFFKQSFQITKNSIFAPDYKKCPCFHFLKTN